MDVDNVNALAFSSFGVGYAYPDRDVDGGPWIGVTLEDEALQTLTLLFSPHEALALAESLCRRVRSGPWRLTVAQSLKDGQLAED